MVFPLIGIAMGLAEFAPAIARWLGGDGAADVAEKAVGVAKLVTGTAAAAGALTALQSDPKLQLEFQRAMAPVIVAEFEAETRRLESVNATMRVEAMSGDRFVRRWRPAYGYIVGISWGVQMAAISYTIVTAPETVAALITAMSSLSVMWGVALSVLGVSVAKRSDDKARAAGQPPPAGLLGAIAGRIAGRG